MRPLLDKLRSANITYHRGFPACLVAIKNGHSSTLADCKRIYKQDLCSDLNLELANWHEDAGTDSVFPDAIWRKKKSPRKKIFTIAV